jgi:hypothetical protein
MQPMLNAKSDTNLEAAVAVDPKAKAGLPRATETDAAPISRKRLWAGRVMSAVAVLFLLFDSACKLMRLAPVVEATAKLGYPASTILPIGLVLLACVVVHVIPRTAIVGAVLLTGYLGGAIATHVRVGDPLFSHTLFPIYFAAMIWGGLYLRDGRLQALIAPRQRT